LGGQKSKVLLRVELVLLRVELSVKAQELALSVRGVG
jgi:hypothetical protein